jgi:hypothetical protein
MFCLHPDHEVPCWDNVDMVDDGILRGFGGWGPFVCTVLGLVLIIERKKD